MKKVSRLRGAQMESSSVSTGNEQLSVRTTGRIKKPKAVFDPSDNYLPRSHRTSSGGNSVDRKKDDSHQEPPPNKKQFPASNIPTASSIIPAPADSHYSCFVCLKREGKRSTSAKNKLLICMACEKRVHKQCLKTEFVDLDLLRQNYKCESCRTCEVCATHADIEAKKELITCSKCVKSYHLTCHFPNVLRYQQFQRNWKCDNCFVSIEAPNITATATITTISTTTTTPPTAAVVDTDAVATPVVATTAVATTEAATAATATAAATTVNATEGATAATTATTTIKDDEDDDVSVVLPVKTLCEIIDDDHHDVEDSVQNDDVIEIEPAAEPKSPTAKRRSSELQVQPDGSNDNESDGNGVPEKKQKIENGTTSESISISNFSDASTIPCSPAYDPQDLENVRNWNVDQVVEYFAKYFPNEAYVFKEQEIDGMSLLLLKRSDVVKKLPIKLGPSLRIYNHILKIQAQKNNETLGWFCGA